MQLNTEELVGTEFIERKSIGKASELPSEKWILSNDMIYMRSVKGYNVLYWGTCGLKLHDDIHCHSECGTMQKHQVLWPANTSYLW